MLRINTAISRPVIGYRRDAVSRKRSSSRPRSGIRTVCMPRLETEAKSLRGATSVRRFRIALPKRRSEQEDLRNVGVIAGSEHVGVDRAYGDAQLSRDPLVGPSQ